MEPETAVIIDGTNLARRAYHAGGSSMLPGVRQRAEALFGQTAVLIAVWDGKGPNFRHRLFPSYKAHRQEAPMAHEFVRADAERWKAMGQRSAMAVDAEADDAAATLTKLHEVAGHEVVLVSSDKDWAQLIRPGVRLMAPPTWELRDAAWVVQTFGVTPKQIPDYLALVGDSADGIPGVRGIGPRTATWLLEKHGTLEAVLESGLDELPDGVRNKLREGRSAARLARLLATLRADVELVAF